MKLLRLLLPVWALSAAVCVGANGYPVTIVVDRSGTVAQVEYGTSPVQRARLKARIRTLRTKTE